MIIACFLARTKRRTVIGYAALALLGVWSQAHAQTASPVPEPVPVPVPVPPVAPAQVISLSGTMGERALLVIDGGAPVVLGVGESRNGVTLISADGELAIVESDGRRQTLRVGERPVSVAGKGSGGNRQRVVLHVGSNGHFFGTLRIRDSTLPFMVDTGASTVVMGVRFATQAGLDYRNGKRGVVSTANGNTQAYGLTLDSVRVGEVEVFNVEATIVPSDMPYVLLGNSFLGRFRIQQENEEMRLERRF